MVATPLKPPSTNLLTTPVIAWVNPPENFILDDTPVGNDAQAALEKQRADQAQIEVERLAELLRSQGIDSGGDRLGGAAEWGNGKGSDRS
jgi:hypothetical protein